MSRLMLLLLLALAACSRAPEPAAGFRDPGTPIYSNAVFEPSRLAGTWVQVAGFGGACRPGGAAFTPSGDGLTLTTRLCLDGREQSFAGPVAVSGPGRLALRGADPTGIGQEWWAIWVDHDYRTLVVGTPSGAFGFILNRDSVLPPDRLTAAREILDWNGYDLGRLILF